MNRSRLVRWYVLGFALHVGMAMGADGPPQGVPSGVDGQHSALHPAGVQAQSIFNLWQGTLWLCIAVFTLILCVLFVGLARARRSSQSEKAEQATAALRTQVDRDSDASRLWVTGATGICGALLVGLVAVDIWTDHALSRLPVGNAVQIEMVGYQWWWEARYPSTTGAKAFGVSSDLHIPAGRPVVVTLKSADVIHTFWVPNLHGKKDMLPGRTTTIAFQADAPGLFRGQCAEFCGAEHALMAFGLRADDPADYEAWHAAQQAPAAEPKTPEQLRGKSVFMASTCAGCHAVRGTEATGGLGPDLTHLASRQHIAAGTVSNDPAHLTQWIRSPQSFKPEATMPGSSMGSDDLQAIVAYLGALR